MPLDMREEGLARFANFLERMRIETRLKRSFEDLYEVVDDTRSSLRDLESVTSEILYGKPLS